MEEKGLIKYLGHQENIPELLELIDVIVLPTFYKEGIPLSLIEGASAGKPIITTNTSGCREIVRHNFNGLLIPPKDTHSLYQAMKDILDGKHSLSQFATNSRALVQEKFSIDIISEQTISIYKSINNCKTPSDFP